MPARLRALAAIALALAFAMGSAASGTAQERPTISGQCRPDIGAYVGALVQLFLLQPQDRFDPNALPGYRLWSGGNPGTRGLRAIASATTDIEGAFRFPFPRVRPEARIVLTCQKLAPDGKTLLVGNTVIAVERLPGGTGFPIVVAMHAAAVPIGPFAPDATVSYVTFRSPMHAPDDGTYFNGSGEPRMRFGICRVETRAPNRLRCRPTAEAAALTPITAKGAIVFVHGFKNSFDDAVRVAAQLGAHLHRPALAFDWASADDLGASGYLADERNYAEALRSGGRDFLAKLPGRIGATGLIAHSMGSRVLQGALDAAPPGAYRFAAAIAGDVDAATFTHDVARLVRGAKALDSYSSTHDDALFLSELIHLFPRLGQAPPVVAPPMVSVDASLAATDPYGHGYFDDPALRTDLREALAGAPPAMRSRLRPSRADGSWQLVP